MEWLACDLLSGIVALLSFKIRSYDLLVEKVFSIQAAMGGHNNEMLL